VGACEWQDSEREVVAGTGVERQKSEQERLQQREQARKGMKT